MGKPLTVREIASIGLPIGAKRGLLWMLKLYLDDSGTHADSPVVGVGGLIGTEAQWDWFDKAWKAILAEPFPDKPPLKVWSSYDCRWGKGEYADYNEAERDRLTFRFREVITNSGVYSASNMIDGIAWNQIAVSQFGDQIASAEGTALFNLLDRIRNWVSRHPEGPAMAIYYDAGRRHDPQINRLFVLLQDLLLQIPEVASFSFLKVADATPLQGADMIATESYWFARDFLKGETDAQRAHFKHYLANNFDRGNGVIMAREGIERAVTKQLQLIDDRLMASPCWQWRARLS